MLPLNRQRLFKEGRTADGTQSALFLPALRHGAVLAHHLAVMTEIDGDIETRQRDAANNLVDMAEFGFLGAHKLAPRGGVVEQIQHFQRGAHRMRGGFNRHVHIPAFGVSLPGFRLLCRAGSER